LTIFWRNCSPDKLLAWSELIRTSRSNYDV